MLAHNSSVFLLILIIGCSAEIGDHYRNISDYQSVKSRFPQAAVKHFPNSAPAGAEMNGYFVPMQGGDGLQLSVLLDKAEFDALLRETESRGYQSSTGVDFDDPQTLLNGKTTPQIILGNDPETPNPKDRIFTIQNGPPIDCGMIFRTDKNIVIYWVFHDG